MGFGPDSRSYEGSYVNRQGERRKVRVKIANRRRFVKMAGLLTAAVMIQGVIVGPIIADTIKDFRNGNSYVSSNVSTEDHRDVVVIEEPAELDRNKEEIQRIINSNPNILKDITVENYEVEYGDSISYLAEKTGNTVSRICELNHMSRNDMLYQGQTLKLEILQDKDELDKEIACLESYFEDYLFRSQTAQEHRNQIFGARSNNTIDYGSFEGRYVTEKANFQSKMESPIELTEEDKKNHIETLMTIESDCRRSLNLSGTENVTPYRKYKVYLENGTTEYDEVKENIHSIYG